MNGTGTPLSFGTELFQGDLDRLEEHLMHCAELIPQFGTCGIQAVINGPVSWPPDGNPILGPVHDDKVRNYWAACGMSYGIAHAGYQSMLSIQSIILFVFVNSQDAAMFSRQVFGTVTTFFKTFPQNSRKPVLESTGYFVQEERPNIWWIGSKMANLQRNCLNAILHDSVDGLLNSIPVPRSERLSLVLQYSMVLTHEISVHFM